MGVLGRLMTASKPVAFFDERFMNTEQPLSVLHDPSFLTSRSDAKRANAVTRALQQQGGNALGND